MWVIKLGGSLAQSPHLTAWLDAISQTDAIIVPGGGPFADAVRDAQAQWHFDEQTAHEMAILGMRQYGRMLLGLCPRLQTLSDLDFGPLQTGYSHPLSLRERARVRGLQHTANPTPARVWLPLPELLNKANIPATWDISSDSLAAWLAAQVHAENLLLVKSVAELNRQTTVDTQIAADNGWIDPAFQQYAKNQPFQSWLCGADGYADLPQSLADPARFFLGVQDSSCAIAR